MKKACLLVSLIPLILSGCSTYGDYRSKFILSKGWVGPKEQNPASPLYCYKTIGEVDCYESPLEGQERRLVNSYQPKVVSAVEPNHEHEEPHHHEHDYEHPHYHVPHEHNAPMRITPL